MGVGGGGGWKEEGVRGEGSEGGGGNDEGEGGSE